MNASNLPKGQSPETPSDARPKNASGVYKHRDTGAVFITSPGEDGATQADALLSPVWKDAWERVGEVPTASELMEMRKAQEQKDAAADKAQSDEKGK